MKDLLYSKDKGVARITLNRPESSNAFSVDMLESWIDALSDAKGDNDIKVVVLSGAGKSFCAGGDIRAMWSGKGFLNYDGAPRGPMRPLDYKNSLWELVQRVPLLLDDLDKPVIASINGHAMGAGLDMALMCDLRIASENARFAESYVNIGLVPGDGGAFLLPRLIGVAKALEMLWTGDVIDAQEAFRIGLVNRVVPADQLEDATMELASRVAARPELAVRTIKRLVYQGLRSDLRTALDRASSEMAILTATEDHKRALQSFLIQKGWLA